MLYHLYHLEQLFTPLRNDDLYPEPPGGSVEEEYLSLDSCDPAYAGRLWGRE